ncbi:hypothetical protein A7979_06455 [Rothia nasimurium]|uniref:2'-5' RNA ligase family protein n=1 Tax=Rothia nasimurium TaxID=85336 RepID=A0A1Y1RLR9_9MICC|nr:2'-5' RNA ligase family protein [Rothia nasimurium]ORC15384.1 hypothetical protein A7979_06455 [Rothia nasimurium]
MTVSPTLQASRGYLSILAQVPAELAERIVTWRLAHGATGEAARSCHITVLITRNERGDEALRQLRTDLSGHGAISLELGTPASFEPVAPVTYLPLTRGAACFEHIHTECAALVGESASPFPYEPHLTLANGLGEGARALSLADFAQLPVHLRSFSVERLEVYRYERENWEHLGNIDLL